MLARDQAIKLATDAGFKELVEEISALGVGSDYEEKFQAGQKVNALEFARWLFTEGKGAKALEFLQPKFANF